MWPQLLRRLLLRRRTPLKMKKLWLRRRRRRLLSTTVRWRIRNRRAVRWRGGFLISIKVI